MGNAGKAIVIQLSNNGEAMENAGQAVVIELSYSCYAVEDIFYFGCF